MAIGIYSKQEIKQLRAERDALKIDVRIIDKHLQIERQQRTLVEDAYNKLKSKIDGGIRVYANEVEESGEWEAVTMPEKQKFMYNATLLLDQSEESCKT